jgi:hypothetical protein
VPLQCKSDGPIVNKSTLPPLLVQLAAQYPSGRFCPVSIGAAHCRAVWIPHVCCVFAFYNIPVPHGLCTIFVSSSTFLLLECKYLALSDMSSFVPGHFADYPPPLGEGPSHPERPQNLGHTNIVISEMLQVVDSMCRLSSFNTY